MRLASLFGPDAIAHAPRATRIRADGDVRVVVGLQALTRAVAEIERLPDGARTPGVAASYDEVTQMAIRSANPDIGRAARPRRRCGRWTTAATPAAGSCAPAKEAPAKLGEILAIKDGDNVVARRRAPDAAPAGRRESTVGVEIIARRLVRVLMRNWVDAVGRRARARRTTGRSSASTCRRTPDNRQTAQRSLIGPDDRFVAGGMVELDTGNARYLIRFTQTLERQARLGVGAVHRGAQARRA